MIRAEIIGANQIKAKLDALGPKLQTELSKSVTKLCLELTRRIKQDKLSGQVLKVKSGQLRRSVTFKVKNTPAGPTGEVGTNLPYAKAHEFGFKGTVDIKSHLRMVKQAWGKPITPTQVAVSPHQRKVNMPERSFMRTALKEMEENIRVEMIEAVKRSMKQ